MARGVSGRLWSIEYRGYCPEGWPPTLAEMFVPAAGGSRPPVEIAEFPHTPGSGYSLTCRHVEAPPIR